jgi:CRISPR/Cas system-associated exonuclease Cas4 (RecB family)
VNHLAIVDYKTTADTDRDARYAMQLQVYAAAGRQEGLEVDACYLHELKSSQRKIIDAEQTDTDNATDWASARVAEIRSGTYPHQAEQDKCEGCDFKLVCRHNLATD